MKLISIIENIIKEGANKKLIDFPELRQIYNYDCGASSLLGVLVYYGLDKREDELIKRLATTKTDMVTNGTKIFKIKEVSEYYGFDCDIKNDMSINSLISHINKDMPVIMLIQAWGDYSNNETDWKKHFDDGHYCVAIGYDGDKIIIEDPSLTTRGYLTKEELKERWHAYDDKGKKVQGTAIIVKGTPKFKSSNIEHINEDSKPKKKESRLILPPKKKVSSNLDEQLNLPKKEIKTEIYIDDENVVTYSTNKFGGKFEITGNIKTYRRGKKYDERRPAFEFEVDSFYDDEDQSIWDEHWEEISDDIESYYWKIPNKTT